MTKTHKRDERKNDAGESVSPLSPASMSVTPVKLSEAQQLALVRGSQNECGELLAPLPHGAIGSDAPEGAFGSSVNDRRMIGAFLKKGLVAGDAGDVFSLRLTALAYASLHIDPIEWPKHLQSEAASFAEAASPSHQKRETTTKVVLRRGSKGARVLAMLQRKSGATLLQMESTTGWQRHSVRGFMSGTLRKKLGLTLESDKSAKGERIYRVCDFEVVQ